MEYVIEGFEPKRLMEHFEELSAVPRPSGREKAASDYLAAFARGLGLEARQDALWNVVVKKPGSAGCEGLPAVMLQGHLDMVCEKNASTAHDFDREGIRLAVRDGWLYADGTTLGADNGAAVALMMTLLEDKGLRHPPLECVFTTQEELGLDGAKAVDPALITARTMINLDSEEEGVATVSCAGGVQAKLSLRLGDGVDRTAAPGWDGPVPAREEAAYKAYVEKMGALKISVGGLRGGHSGIDIGLGRGNAILLAGRLLSAAAGRGGACLMSLNGGNKDNAIPRECVMELFLDDPADLYDALRRVEEKAEEIRAELSASDPGLWVRVEPVKAGRGFAADDTARVADLLALAPNGVQNRNAGAGGFVVCSSNLGVARVEGNTAAFTFMIRSSVDSLKEEVLRKLDRLQGRLGFDGLELREGYPGWAYAERSPVREVLCESYRALFGGELRCEAIHAGLECGIFSGKLPGLDAIAIGPRIEGCHTPDERLDLASFGRAYRLVVDVLERLAARWLAGS